MRIAKNKAIPTSRIARASQLGGFVAKLAGNVLLDSSKSLLKGEKLSTSELLLTPANIKNLTEKLAQMRGAAMKLGQIISMDSGDLLPKELADILSKLQDNAYHMPHKQLVSALENSLGKNWIDKFAYFNLTPFASASIGQVHLAHDEVGRKLAVKVQYPGVSDAIESDVDNLGTLLKASRLVPKHIDINPLLSEAKKQLSQEADYLFEASASESFSKHLNKQLFSLPVAQPDSNKQVLIMSYIEGAPLSSLEALPQDERNSIVLDLFRLFFNELFNIKLMQTDPNFANYVYCIEEKKIGLLDFGATRTISESISNGYKQLLISLVKHSEHETITAAKAIGFFQDSISETYLQHILMLFELASTPIRIEHDYDFASCDLPNQIRGHVMEIKNHQAQWHSPPIDAIFIHRKIVGLYLIAKKLKSKVNVHNLIKEFI